MVEGTRGANEDTQITKAIAKFKRAGVPLNVLYYSNKPEDPFIFPAVLTHKVVTEALNTI